MSFVEDYPGDFCFTRFDDISNVFRMKSLHLTMVRLVALSLAFQIIRKGTPSITIMDPFCMRESVICNRGDRLIATKQIEEFFMVNIYKSEILIPYFPE
jgi:hypothetical protein